MLVIMFIFGLIIGSFLNVCIYRIPEGNTVVNVPSHCPSCKSKLKPVDLLPVISYIILGGKCRYCGQSIGIRYPLVELTTGAVFIISYLTIGLNLLLVKYLVIYSILIIITLIDLKHKIIPNVLVLTLLVWAVTWQLAFPDLPHYEAVVGGLLGGGIFLLIAVLSKGGMGGGDIKLMFSAGIFLGVMPAILAILISSIVGGIIGLILILLKIKDRKDPIPFGPFLSLGIFLTSLWGQEIIELYLAMIL